MRSVNSTEIQNNFGKYLVLANREDILITKNGMDVACLTTRNIKQDMINEPDVAHRYIENEMAYEDFIQFTKNSEDRLEFIDGQVYSIASPKVSHQLILNELFAHLHAWFSEKKCIPITSPFDITLKDRKNNMNVVQPDILVICDLEEGLNEYDQYMGVPMFIIEILSDSTKKRDMMTKMDLYMASGVKEYWMLDPAKQKAITYKFHNDEMIDYAIYFKHEVITSYIFKGLKIDLKRIFR